MEIEFSVPINKTLLWKKNCEEQLIDLETKVDSLKVRGIAQRRQNPYKDVMQICKS